METVFELQSFRRCTATVTHELVGEATREGRRVPFSLAIDKETYREIRQCVGLKDGCRYRLSSRCKWDPFRRQYYSSVTRIGQSRRQLLYFPCSTAYRDALSRLRDISFTPSPGSPRSVFHFPKAATYTSIIGICLAMCIITLYYFSGANLTITPNRVVQAAQQPAMQETWARVGPVDMATTVAETPPSGTGGLTSEPDENLDDGGKKGTPSAALEAGAVVNSLPEGFVALTFDDGPSPYTREIVDILSEHKVTATFFFIGLHTLKYPGAVQYASDRNMVVGNHSWSHTSLRNGGSEKLRDEIVKTNERLSSLTNLPVTVFRPPFGHTSDQLIDVVADEQMKIALWNRDPRDWNSKNAQSITDYVRNTNPSGGIYVLHENELTVQALPEIISYMKQNGVTFTVLN